jgi:recombinational DNA repair protein RecT
MSNQLTLTKAAIEGAPNLKALFELDGFRGNYVKQYALTTRKADGDMIWEREKVLFMKAIQASPKIEKCTKFSIYSSFIELAVSGLTLLDGEAYIIPYGEVAQFQPGWKGRLKQISRLDYVRYVNDPVLVYETDEFDYEIVNGVTNIKKHRPNIKRSASEKITFVYLSIETDFGFKIHLMTIADVYAIRDRYSQTYKQYVADVKSKGLKMGDSFKKTMNGRNGPYEITVEPPFWVTDEPQAVKKTLVKRVYNSGSKSARMKALDAQIKNNFDPETGEIHETEDIDYGVVDSDTQPTSSEQVTPKVSKPVKPKNDPTPVVDRQQVINDVMDEPTQDGNQKPSIENPLDSF